MRSLWGWKTRRQSVRPTSWAAHRPGYEAVDKFMLVRSLHQTRHTSRPLAVSTCRGVDIEKELMRFQRPSGILNDFPVAFDKDSHNISIKTDLSRRHS